jgi:hypothetical protein
MAAILAGATPLIGPKLQKPGRKSIDLQDRQTAKKLCSEKIRVYVVHNDKAQPKALVKNTPSVLPSVYSC